MPQLPRLRPLVCLAAVLGLHLVLIAIFLARPVVAPGTAARISTVWLIPEAAKVAKITPITPITPRRKVADSRSRPSITIPAQQLSVEAPTLSSTLPSASQPPTLDLEAMHQLAVREALKPGAAPIVVENGLSGADRTLEAHIDAAARRAQHSDCRTAHSGAGLFAPLMIAADLIRDKGCQF